MAKGRATCLAIALLAAAALLQPSAAATVHVVGGSLGWLVPPGGYLAYETWADTQTFIVGDTLIFNFTTGEQDVARVTKEAYDTCNSTNPIFVNETGPFSLTLDAAGEYFFIGTMSDHCSLGQKLAINVSTTSRAPVTYTVGDSLGWLVPPAGSIAYSTWAYDKTFLVGDVLVFNFTDDTQDVAVVTKDAYDSCNTTTPIAVYTSSPVKYTLPSAGEHFFTSTYSRHCALGQKLAINVTASTYATSPSASITPSSGNPSSSSAESPTTAPLPVSSAPAREIFGFSLALLSVALALVH